MTFKNCTEYFPIFDTLIGSYSSDQSFKMLPDFFTKDKKLLKREMKRKEEIEKESAEKLKKTGIVTTTLDNTDDISIRLTELLARHKLEKR